jgi:hypothetical protein
VHRGQEADSRPGTPAGGQQALTAAGGAGGSPFKPVLKKSSAVDLVEIEGVNSTLYVH